MKITLEDLAALEEAIDRADDAFTSTSESANQEQERKTARLRDVVAALRLGAGATDDTDILKAVIQRAAGVRR